MKNLTMFFFLIVLTASSALADTCEVDGDDGSWKTIRNRYWDYYDKNPWPTDYSCDLQGEGALTALSVDRYTYQLKVEDTKAIEVVDACESIKTCPEDGLYHTDCRDCAGHLDDSNSCFRRVWPACLTNGTELPPCNASVNECLSQPCRDRCYNCGDGMWFEHSPYGAVTCGLQSYCRSPVVRQRTFFQWVCNSCSEQFDNLITECDGVTNIFSFDNETCKGECKNKTEPNLGPPKCEER